MAGMGTRRPSYAARRVPAVPAVLAAGLVLGLSAGLTACGGDQGPSPGPTADALAAGLSSGDLSKVTFVDTSAAAVQHQYAATVAGLGSVKPKVTVESVDTQGD